MSLYHLYKTPMVLDKPTHQIFEILNGQMDVRNIKLLRINAGVTLGGHSHDFYEGKVLLEGKIVYQLKHRFGTAPEARDIVMEPIRDRNQAWASEARSLDSQVVRFVLA